MFVDFRSPHAGWIPLHVGMAGGVDVILVPELSYNIYDFNDFILLRAARKKPYSIVVVAEGIETPEGKKPAEYIAKMIKKSTGIDTRETVLGHIQRGGNPSPFDRILSTRLGCHATALISKGDFGKMVCVNGSQISSIPLKDVANKLKLIEPGHVLIEYGKQMGICFVDRGTV